MIRELVYEDFKDASLVLWKSFYDAEKNNHSLEGMELFRDLTSPVSLSINSFEGKIRFFGYFEKNILLAVGAIKDHNHILLLYVLPDSQGKGIGREILLFLESECREKRITVNSSDCGIPFYQRHGYTICGERNCSDGLITTPMEKNV
ncbi:MAG: GNAT family N-acetyltransferase [Ruminococcaceae bacterium]|nr:GNAT family N-acetyltransferase [Oscillospiraceae bacterium]